MSVPNVDQLDIPAKLYMYIFSIGLFFAYVVSLNAGNLQYTVVVILIDPI